MLAQMVDALEYARELGTRPPDTQARQRVHRSRLHAQGRRLRRRGRARRACGRKRRVTGGARRATARPSGCAGQTGDARADVYSLAQVALDVLAGGDATRRQRRVDRRDGAAAARLSRRARRQRGSLARRVPAGARRRSGRAVRHGADAEVRADPPARHRRKRRASFLGNRARARSALRARRRARRREGRLGRDDAGASQAAACRSTGFPAFGGDEPDTGADRCSPSPAITSSARFPATRRCPETARRC